jgi:hypothetical protein
MEEYIFTVIVDDETEAFFFVELLNFSLHLILYLSHVDNSTLRVHNNIVLNNCKNIHSYLCMIRMHGQNDDDNRFDQWFKEIYTGF